MAIEGRTAGGQSSDMTSRSPATGVPAMAAIAPSTAAICHEATSQAASSERSNTDFNQNTKTPKQNCYFLQ